MGEEGRSRPFRGLRRGPKSSWKAFRLEERKLVKKEKTRAKKKAFLHRRKKIKKRGQKRSAWGRG